MLDAAFRPILYDCLCVFFLTLSSAARGRVAGEAPTGCFLLAVFSALTYPVGRELLLNGSCLAVFSSFPHQLSLLAGAFLGTLLLSFGRFFDRFLPLLDLTALALTSSFTVLCVLPRCDPPAALLLAFFLSLFPQLVTDLALGDVSRLVSQSWVPLRAFLGAVLTVSLTLLLPLFFAPPFPVDGLALLSGVALPLLVTLRFPRD